MANTLYSYFTNIAQSSMAVLSKRLMPLNIFTTDLSPEMQQGNAVTTRIVPASATPVDRSAIAWNDATIVGDITTTSVTCTLDQDMATGYQVTDDEVILEKQGVIAGVKSRVAELKVNALADQMLTYVYGKILAASFTNTALTAGDAVAFDYDNVVDHMTTLTSAHFPIDQTAYVLNPSYIGALLKDARVSNMDSSGLPAIAQGAGALKSLAGMPLYQAVTLPSNSQNLVGFACQPDAIAVAMRTKPVSQAPVGTEFVEVVTDPQTGASMTMYAFRDSTKRAWNITFNCWYGAVKANQAKLYRIVSA